MSTPMRSAIPVIIVAALAGCASFGAQEPQRYYVLDVPAGPAVPASPRASTLLVAPTMVPGFYETQEIVYSRTPGTRAYYQLHAWTERPGPRLTGLLVKRLDRTGSFRAVATAVSGVRGDLVLSASLDEFYHDAVQAPGSARVTLTVELTDSLRRVFIARRTFTRAVPAITYDAPGAVLAFNSALGGLLDEVAAWVEATAPR